MRNGHIPIRTCIGCRERRDKKSMIRLTLGESCRAVRDDRGVKGGRGAYVCRNGSCLEKLKKRDLLRRALKSSVPVELDAEIRIE